MFGKHTCVRVQYLRWSKSNLKTEIEWQTKHWTIVAHLLILVGLLIKDDGVRDASTQGRIQPARLGGWQFQKYLVVKSHNDFPTVREMKHTSQQCCDQTMDDKKAWYRECCFPNCTKSWWIKLLSQILGGGDRPPLDPPLPQPQTCYWYRFVIDCYLLLCNNFNEALTYLPFFNLKSCEAVISYFILSEVARKLSRFCKMPRKSKVVWAGPQPVRDTRKGEEVSERAQLRPIVTFRQGGANHFLGVLRPPWLRAWVWGSYSGVNIVDNRVAN